MLVIYLLIGVSLSVNGSDELPSTASSHCFKRISGGERLIGYDVTRIIERNTVEECEEECNTYKCTHFSFGNVTGRNGTCELTTDREISRTQDPNFDLYQRTDECVEGKPTGYEKGNKREIGQNSETKNRIIVNGRHHHGDRRLYLIQACYRRIITGKRLHERFIRHSLPCNSLQACQHQCSIEKHFTCQGFNIRLDPARVGRGICELSSVITTHLDPARDFIFDPEFAYYERDNDNGLPNCGHFNTVGNAVPPHNSDENTIGYRPPTIGGPYYGGDSYGPWSTGHGTVDHGPWGSHGYGSGFYESNNPSRGPAPSFHPDTPGYGQGYGYGYSYGSGSQNSQGPSGSFPNNFLPGSYGPQIGGGSISRGPGPFYSNGPGSQNNYGNRFGYGYEGSKGHEFINVDRGPDYSYGYGDGSQGHGNRGSGTIAPDHGYGPGDRLPSGVTSRPGGTGPYGYGYGYGGGSPGSGVTSRPGGTGSYGHGYDYDYGSGSPSSGVTNRPGGTGPYGYGYGYGGASPGSGVTSRPGGTGPYGYGYGYGGGSPGSGVTSRPGGTGPYGYGYGYGGASPGSGVTSRPGGTGPYGHGYGYGYSYGGGPKSHESRGPGSIAPGYGPVDGSSVINRPGGTGSYGYSYDYGGGSPSGVINRPGGAGSYGYGNKPYPGRPKVPDSSGGKPLWGQSPSIQFPASDKRYDRPNRIPTYIIIDADARGGHGPNYRPNKPSSGYLPVGPPALPPPRPLPRPPQLPPPPIHPPPSYSFAPGGSDKFGISANTIGREVCFRREHPGYKLNTNTIKGMYETPTVLDCEAMCTSSLFKCTGYSFRYSSSGSGPNCLLTDFTSLIPETHLLPDRSCDVYFKMGTCMEFDRVADTECFLKVATNRKLNPSKLVKMVTVSGMSECELACLSSGLFTCRSFSFRHGPPVIGEPIENCFLSDWPISALTHLDFIPLANHEVYERGSFGHGCELDAGPPHHIGPRPPFTPYPNVPQIPHAKDPWTADETWRHFTVSGWPCRRGTECELNPQAGFWACEVEGGDRAQWDYCCRPKHSCGFSRGYHYPWCYVGEAGPDQWRPCSEFYYPEFDNRYSYKPVHSQPDDSYGPPTDTRPWNFGSEEFGPPSYWPISYIYAEPPPNETYIWDPEDQLFYHHHEDYHAPEDFEDSPKIKFKPCGNRHPYPRAIIQKLDLKNIPKAPNPGEQVKKEEKPKIPKSELGFSSENRDKKNSQDFFQSTFGNHTERESNGTNVSLNKTKEIIKEVEKIIMESTTESELEKNESLTKVETKNPGFFSISLLEKDFWN